MTSLSFEGQNIFWGKFINLIFCHLTGIATEFKAFIFSGLVK